jgi:hypothetical protein
MQSDVWAPITRRLREPHPNYGIRNTLKQGLGVSDSINPGRESVRWAQAEIISPIVYCASLRGGMGCAETLPLIFARFAAAATIL